MTETATHASPNAALIRRFFNGFAIAAIAALFMTVTGALSTGKIGFGPRLIYWLIIMEMGALIGVAVNAGMREWRRFESQKAIEAIIVAVLIAFPLTLVVTGTSMIFFGGGPPNFVQATAMFVIVAFVSLVMTGINYLLPTKPGAQQPVALSDTAPHTAPSEEPPQPATPRFAERLPIGMQSARILALSAEDHYLRVHTDSGDALILMRLSDAIAEIEAANGLQTHRSWWVARDAVTSAKRSESKGVIQLTNGVEVPVSRTYLKAVGAAGWFA